MFVVISHVHVTFPGPQFSCIYSLSIRHFSAWLNFDSFPTQLLLLLVTKAHLVLCTPMSAPLSFSIFNISLFATFSIFSTVLGLIAFPSFVQSVYSNSHTHWINTSKRLWLPPANVSLSNIFALDTKLLITPVVYLSSLYVLFSSCFGQFYSLLL